MKYDDASWHYGVDEYPKELPREAAATHTGMFLAWAVLCGLGGELAAQELPKLRARAVTPGKFFFDTCDGKFVDEDLNDEGNRFVRAYFDLENGTYLKDYDRVLCAGLETAYHVPDTWSNFDRLKPRLDRRLDEWRRGVLGRRPWWRFWD
jgi:hypothetical protein